MKKSKKQPSAIKQGQAIRVRFAGEIVAEVLLPERQTGKIALFASGAPSMPVKKERLQFLAEHGYIVIFPRYRGTWESSGYFLEKSPAQDIRDIIVELDHKKQVVDVATNEHVSIKVSSLHLFGGSFGGPAVLLNTDLPMVKKVIAVSPVIDWKVEGEDEPFDEWVRYCLQGFGGAYRTKELRGWEKPLKTDYYNPLSHTSKIDGKKVFIIHAKDDTNVPYNPVIPFSEKTGATYYIKPTGGHRIDFTHGFLWKKIEAFLKKK